MKIYQNTILFFILIVSLLFNSHKALSKDFTNQNNFFNSALPENSSKNNLIKNNINGTRGKKASLINTLNIASGKYKEDEIIIKFKRGVNSLKKESFFSKNKITVKKSFEYISAEVVKIPSGKNIVEAIEEIKKDSNVEYAEPNYVYSISTIPNDPEFKNLWGLYNTTQTGGTDDADIDATEAWDKTTGSGSVVVGVIDTGVDYTHEDLKDNMWVNPGEIADNGLDDDGNGVIDDIHGYNAVMNNGDPMDDHSHGTHVSGTIGAVGNNGIGVVGVNWNVKIMALKFLDGNGSGWTSDALECIDYVIKMKDKGINVKITSNSWGGGSYSQALYDAISSLKGKGILFVAAAGNSGSDNDAYPMYPSSYDLMNIISVAATDRNDGKASWSSYGLKTVDVGAPGVDIISSVLSTDKVGIYYSGAYKLVYFSFGFEGINGASSRNTIMNKVVNFYGLQNTDSILIVDDDGGYTYESYYTSALTNLGYTNYDLITVPKGSNGPSSFIMSKYKLVIWFTGDDYYTTLNDIDQSNLSSFLNNGGNLFITGSEIGYDIGYKNFYNNFLKAEYISDASSSKIFNGEGIFAGESIDLSTSSGDGAKNQRWIDVVRPLGGALPAFNNVPYAKYSGTSMATPHVAGLAALIWDYRPSDLNYKDIRKIIFSSVDKISSLNEKTVTGGRINADKAINATSGFLPVNQLPVADIGKSALWSERNKLKSFNGAGSYDPDGCIVSYMWDFGDGGTDTTVSVKHTFTSIGTHMVTLTVTDDEGASAVDIALVKISDFEVAPAYGYNTTVTPIIITSNGGNFDTTCKVYIEPQVSGILSTIDTPNSAYDVYVSGNYAYVADYDSGLQVIDISDPSNPVITGKLDTDGYAYGVYVAGDYAYIADYYNGLEIIDIKNPKIPVKVGSVSIDYARGVYVSGNYAYVADYYYGLKIVDIKTPGNPVIVSTEYLNYARDVYVQGNYAYVIGYNDLSIIDVSDPANPNRVGSIYTPGYSYGIYVSGDYAYVADQDEGLQIINISNPLSPDIVSSIGTPGYAYGVYVSGNYAYVAENDFGLQVIDVTDPNNPVLIQTIDTPGNASGVNLSGNYVYIADKNAGVDIIEIVSNGALVGTVDTPGFAEGICISGNYAYLADDSTGLQVVDITDPVNPLIIGSVDTPGYACGIFIKDNYAYIADWDAGLQIIDITNPSNPVKVGNVDTPGGAYGLYVDGNYAYVADFDFGLQVIDISNPANPVIVGSIDTSGYALGVFVKGNYAYVADYYYGLLVIDISSPAKPVKTGSIDTPGEACGIYVSGNYAYVADYGSGLKQIDISNPVSPKITGSIDTPGSAYGVYVSGDYAYVADFEAGLQVVNISDTTNLKIENNVDTPGDSYAVVTKGNFIFVADGKSGMQVIRFNNTICNSAVYIDDKEIASEVPMGLLEGVYNIKVANSSNEEAVIKRGFTVLSLENRVPSVFLSADVSSGHFPLSVKFTAKSLNATGNILEFKWDFDGNGSYETITADSTVTYNYTIPGTYFSKVKVNYDDTSFAEGILRINVTNNVPVITSFKALPNSGYAPLLVTFGVAASDSDGSIVQYVWDFNGDGVYDTTISDSTITYTFETAGSYYTKVKVIDNYGAIVTAIINKVIKVDVQSNIPAINYFSSVPNSGYAPLLVTFEVDASDSNGSIVEYKWDFNGDGVYDTAGPDSTITYTFETAGSYYPIVKAADNDGDSTEYKSATKITVAYLNHPPSINSFKATPHISIAPINVKFIVDAIDVDNKIVSYEWDFDGDNSYDTLTNTNTVNHLYKDPGTHICNVKVKDTDGGTAIAARSVVAVLLIGNIDSESLGSANRVDGHDLYTLGISFGSVPSDINWNPMTDFDGNDIIDGIDLVLFAINFGKSAPQ